MKYSKPTNLLKHVLRKSFKKKESCMMDGAIFQAYLNVVGIEIDSFAKKITSVYGKSPSGIMDVIRHIQDVLSPLYPMLNGSFKEEENINAMKKSLRKTIEFFIDKTSTAVDDKEIQIRDLIKKILDDGVLEDEPPGSPLVATVDKSDDSIYSCTGFEESDSNEPMDLSSND